MKTIRLPYIVSGILIVALALTVFLALPETDQSSAANPDPVLFFDSYGQPVDPWAKNDGNALDTLTREEHDQFQEALSANKDAVLSSEPGYFDSSNPSDAGVIAYLEKQKLDRLDDAASISRSSNPVLFFDGVGMPIDPWANWNETAVVSAMGYSAQDRAKYQITEVEDLFQAVPIQSNHSLSRDGMNYLPQERQQYQITESIN